MDAIVTSTVQPAGTSTLFDISNATGYVTFQNATAGNYSFSITKVGYPSRNETIPNYNAQPLTLTIALVGNGSSGSAKSGITLIEIILVVVVVAVVAGVAGLLIMRRGQSPNEKRLKELRKQMKPKYET